jgi:translation initiation factor 2 alpha subunit (eIF-2alpha)
MRFYKEEYPKVDTIVMCKVLEQTDYCLNVELLEYNGKQGMVTFNEISTRKIKRIKDVLDIGRIYPLLVIAVDEYKGYIDLSNKHIASQDELQQTVEKYNLYKSVVSLIKSIVFLTDNDYLDFCDRTIWRLDKNETHDYLMKIRDDLALLDIFEFVNDEEKNKFSEILLHQFLPVKWNLQQIISIQTYDIDGVEKIQNLFKIVPNDIEVRLLSSPNYTLSIKETTQKEYKLAYLSEITNLLKENAEKNNFKFAILKLTETQC